MVLILFDESITRYLDAVGAGMRSKATIKGYHTTLNMLREYLETRHNSKVYTDELQGSDIESFFNYLKSRGNTTATTSTHQVRINAFFRYALSQNWISEDISKVMLKIRRRLAPKEYLSYEEIEKIVELIEQPVIKLFFRTLYFTGLRLNEAINLKIEDVDLEKRVISVKSGKGGKHRKIPISEKLHELLSDYLKNKRPKHIETNSFFATAYTGKLSEGYATMSLRTAVKEAGIFKGKKITTHTFRHSFASTLVKKRVNIKVIQKLLGHSDITTTSIYLNANMDDMESAINEL